MAAAEGRAERGCPSRAAGAGGFSFIPLKSYGSFLQCKDSVWSTGWVGQVRGGRGTG